MHITGEKIFFQKPTPVAIGNLHKNEKGWRLETRIILEYSKGK